MNRNILLDFTDFLNLIHYYEDDPYYICFNNGYYNLKTRRFNKTNTSKLDYKINYDYQDFTENNPIILQIKQYMKQVFPRKKERGKAWKMLTTFLTGRTNRNQEGLIYYWIGTGSNSKSLFLRFIMKSLDKYASYMGFPYREISAQTQPTIIANKNKRLFSLGEVDLTEIPDLTFLKQFTTNDTIVVSGFNLQLKNHVIFSGNQMIDSRHNNSLIVIRFDSSFLFNPRS